MESRIWGDIARHHLKNYVAGKSFPTVLRHDMTVRSDPVGADPSRVVGIFTGCFPKCHLSLVHSNYLFQGWLMMYSMSNLRDSNVFQIIVVRAVERHLSIPQILRLSGKFPWQFLPFNQLQIY